MLELALRPALLNRHRCCFLASVWQACRFCAASARKRSTKSIQPRSWRLDLRLLFYLTDSWTKQFSCRDLRLERRARGPYNQRNWRREGVILPVGHNITKDEIAKH